MTTGADKVLRVPGATHGCGKGSSGEREGGRKRGREGGREGERFIYACVCVMQASHQIFQDPGWESSQRKNRHLGSEQLSSQSTVSHEERGGVYWKNTEIAGVSQPQYRFFGRSLCPFLFPTERSTEEETPIARAVSGSCAFELSAVGLCVCVCVCVCELSQNQPTFIADYGFFLWARPLLFSSSPKVFVRVCAQPTFIATICLHRFVKDGEYQKEIRGIRLNHRSTDRAQHIPPSAPPTCKESRGFYFGHGLCSFLFPDREIYRGRDTYH